MEWLSKHARRVLTDTAGYLLLLAALATGWLPGPGGIPLALAGLWLLSVHNPWARHLRRYVTLYGSTVVGRFLFGGALLRFIYDIIVFTLLVAGGLLLWLHGERWQVALAATCLGIAIGLSFFARKRYARLLLPFKRKL